MRKCCAEPTLLRPLLGILIASLSSGAYAADEPVAADDISARFEAQIRQIEALKRELARQEAALFDLKHEVDLERRGRGVAPTAGSERPVQVAQAQPAQAQPAQPVGQAPEAPDRPPAVAPIFEQKTTTTPPADATAKAAEAIAKAKAQVPTSLSQVPAGSAAHHDEGEAIRNKSGLSLMQTFEGKSSDEILKLMSRVI